MFGVFVTQDLFVFFLFYEIAVLPMYLLIGIWGSSHAITEGGPFKFVWKLLDIGGREYAAMKLTLMLLVGSAFILVAIFAMYVGRWLPHLRHGRPRRSVEVPTRGISSSGPSRCSGSASAPSPAFSRSTPGRPTATPPRPRLSACSTPAC